MEEFGIRFETIDNLKAQLSFEKLSNRLKNLGIQKFSTAIHKESSEKSISRMCLIDHIQFRYFPDFSTINTSKDFKLDSQSNLVDLEREIYLCLLASPIKYAFRDFEELESSVRMRIDIVRSSQQTLLNFDTTGIERPEDFWTYSEETGFVIKQGKSLIDGLTEATQPKSKPYSFSCYRATEYVLLLSIAKEAYRINPEFLRKIETQWQHKAISSGSFHDTFLIEFGTQNSPIPMEFFIPGDRVWFRNPDEASSNVEGFEGSWVFYLGDGLFSNFWVKNKPFTLEDKLLEIYHWRHGLKTNGTQLTIDESIVSEYVKQSKANLEDKKNILKLMHKYKDARGISKDGGAMDTTREAPKPLNLIQL